MDSELYPLLALYQTCQITTRNDTTILYEEVEEIRAGVLNAEYIYQEGDGAAKSFLVFYREANGIKEMLQIVSGKENYVSAEFIVPDKCSAYSIEALTWEGVQSLIPLNEKYYKMLTAKHPCMN